MTKPGPGLLWFIATGDWRKIERYVLRKPEMEMILSVVGSIALVGIFAVMGSFWVARDLGRTDATGGVILLVYSIVMTGIVFFAFPHGNLPGLETFAAATPYVLLISVGAGLLRGLYKRTR